MTDRAKEVRPGKIGPKEIVREMVSKKLVREIRPSEDRRSRGNSNLFSVECLQAGLRVRFQARGASMSPAIRDGETVYVRPASEADLRRGDIVLVKSDIGFRLHRLIHADASRDVFITRGDCGAQDDPAVRHDQILGVAVAKDVRLGTGTVRANFRGMAGLSQRIAARGQAIAEKIMRIAVSVISLQGAPRAVRDQVRNSLVVLSLLILMLAAPYASGQVAVDASTSGPEP